MEKVTEPSRLCIAFRGADIRIDQEFERINVECVFVNLKRFLRGGQYRLIGRFARQVIAAHVKPLAAQVSGIEVGRGLCSRV